MEYYVVDAFTDKLFKGNPAGVCILNETIDEKLMQSIAMENNLSETAFVVKNGDSYDLRWFTPAVEVPLCGHATIAAAFVISNFVDVGSSEICFNTKSGLLTVRKGKTLFVLDFVADKPLTVEVTDEMERAFGVPVVEAYRTVDSENLVLVLECEQAVLEAKPDMALIARLASHSVNLTARGESADFVSRFFAPNVGVDEDPVTGSAHTRLVPLWAQKLGKDELVALQLSKRGGKLVCVNYKERVSIAGKAVLYLEGKINV